MRKPLTVLAVLIVLAVIGGGVYQYQQSQVGTPPGLFPGRNDGTSQEAAPAQPAQPDWCPRVEFIAAPGTWESSATDDPLNPTANPNSFMLSITNPLKQRYATDDVKVWTLPYTAQFRNVNSNEEMSYDDSRTEGENRLNAELSSMHAQCPATKFILAGFSQGAVIVGDIADAIGGGSGAVPADAIAGVTAIADGRRENGVGINPGVQVAGIGAEIALKPVNLFIQAVVPGATMRGARPNGFGALSDRTYEICAPDDSVCDAPLDAGNGIDRAAGLISATGIHAQYASNPNVIPGTTTSDWTVRWAAGIIDGI